MGERIPIAEKMFRVHYVTKLTNLGTFFIEHGSLDPYDPLHLQMSTKM